MSRNPVASYTMLGFRMGRGRFQGLSVGSAADPAANATMGDTAENLARQYQITRPEVDARGAQLSARLQRRRRASRGARSPPSKASWSARALRHAPSSSGGAKELAADTHVRPLTGRDARDHPPGFRRSADRYSLRYRRRGGGTGRFRRLRAQVRQAAARAHRGGRDRGQAAAHHGHRPGAGDFRGARARRDCAQGCRPLRDQRGLWRPGDGLRARARHRRSQVNVNGGAIAIGHLLGATGVRLAVTLASSSARGYATESPRPASAAARASRC